LGVCESRAPSIRPLLYAPVREAGNVRKESLKRA
jgi:hypothetical protein